MGSLGPILASMGDLRPMGDTGLIWAYIGDLGPILASMGNEGPLFANLGDHGALLANTGDLTVQYRTIVTYVCPY